MGVVQQRADGDNAQLKGLDGQHSTVTKALHSLQKIPKAIPK